MASATAPVTIEKLGVKVTHNPTAEQLKSLGVGSWPTWDCPVSEFDWTYSGTETAFLMKGRVKLTPAGSTDFIEFGAGDLVVFPDGMSCKWTVTEPVYKHYKFD